MISLNRGSCDVIVGMDWLSKRKFVMVCHEKVVRIPLEGDEIRRVHDERTQGVVKTLMNIKVDELKLNDVSVVRDFIDVFPEDLSMTTAMTKEEHGVHLKLALELLRKEKLYAKFTKSESNVKDNILATPSETSKVENAPAEMQRDLDQQMEKRADDDNSMEWNSGDDQLRLRLMIYLVVLADVAESVRDTIGFEYCSEIEESSLTGPELVLDTTNKVVLIKEKLKAARDRQKSYADNRRKSLEFEVEDRVMLKVSPWKGDIRFGKKEIMEREKLQEFKSVGFFYLYEKFIGIQSVVRVNWCAMTILKLSILSYFVDRAVANQLVNPRKRIPLKEGLCEFIWLSEHSMDTDREKWTRKEDHKVVWKYIAIMS
ncbi:hypothetical protein Tco_0393148 [Tanacetum coccineum]